jgi:hypothetical protein
MPFCAWQSSPVINADAWATTQGGKRPGPVYK